ncbi:MAG: TFIIB-type zinc ribbon-containing protein [Planctomycetota bacterium]|jgi:uncharacterized protein YecA (UPF0149 family)
MTEFTHRLPHDGWSRPSRNEEEYFHREEFARRMKVARERQRARAAEERERLLAIRRDHCPKCGANLETLEVDGITAEQCPGCLGVWLDHETFDHLTHPSKPNQYLTGILRELILEYTTGSVEAEEAALHQTEPTMG